MRTSETIGALALALSKAQGMIKAAIKDTSNPFFKSAYADLASEEAVRKYLSMNELAVIQTADNDENKISVTTLLVHNSGEWIENTAAIIMDAQRAKHVLRELLRYSLSVIIGGVK